MALLQIPSKTVFRNWRPGLAWFFCALLLGGMVYSPFLQSLSMFGLIVLAVFNRENLKTGRGEILRQFFHRPDFWTIGFYFAIVLIGGLYSEDSGYWLERLRIKTPFLLLPFAFFLLPSFTTRAYLGLWYFLLILLSVTSLGIALNYGLHFQEINAGIKMGQPMPMPCNHIRYSLLQTMGVVGGLYLLEKGFMWRSRWEKQGIAALVLWLIAAQHLIAVRSGLVVLYAVLLLVALRYIWRTRKFLAGAALLLVLASGPVLAYQLVPSLRTKIGYMRYDLDMYLKGQDQGRLSDASRWISWKIGWDLFRESPWLGVGPGNLNREVEKMYDEKYPDSEKRLIPHNQFLIAAAGSGVGGLVLFLVAFFLPFFYRRHYLHFPLLALYITAFLSFLVEATLENAMGVAFFLFFLVLGLNYLKEGRDGKAAV